MRSKSNRLRLKDLREIYRLIGQCRDVGDDAPAWRRHLLEGLCQLTGAQVGICATLKGFGSPDQRILHAVELGWDGPVERGHFLRYQADDGERRDPSFQKLSLLRGRLITRARSQLLDDKAWYGSDVYNHYLRPARIDDKIMSFLQLSPEDQSVQGVAVKRPPGERAFSQREVRLVHWCHHELTPLVGKSLTCVPEPLLDALPRRLREVLACLLEGDSEKQVALVLGISPHTVHVHVTRLYRHFDVSSRGELHALFLRRHRATRTVGAATS